MTRKGGGKLKTKRDFMSTGREAHALLSKYSPKYNMKLKHYSSKIHERKRAFEKHAGMSIGTIYKKAKTNKGRHDLIHHISGLAENVIHHGFSKIHKDPDQLSAKLHKHLTHYANTKAHPVIKRVWHGMNDNFGPGFHCMGHQKPNFGWD